MTTIALVTIAHGRHDHLQNQAVTVAEGTRRPDFRIVVAMNDRSLRDSGACVLHLETDSPELPLAAARNIGAHRAMELGAEVLVFLDVDCMAGAGLIDGYASAVQDESDVVWSGPVTYLDPPTGDGYVLGRLDPYDRPHPGRPAPDPGVRVLNPRAELFWSLSFALHRDAWSRIGGFCEKYIGYGAEDTDFGRLVSSHGLRHGWTGDARAYHQHHDVERPPVRHLDAILRNGAVFHTRWGEWPMTSWLKEFADMGLIEFSSKGWRRSTPRSAGSASVP